MVLIVVDYDCYVVDDNFVVILDDDDDNNLDFD